MVALAYVDLVADPLSGLRVADVETPPKPTIRGIHTYITMNDDAGVSRELVRTFTRYGLDTIDQGLKCYETGTADQAAAAPKSVWPTRSKRKSRTSQRVRLARATNSQHRSPKTLASLKRMSLTRWRARRDSNS